MVFVVEYLATQTGGATVNTVKQSQAFVSTCKFMLTTITTILNVYSLYTVQLYSTNRLRVINF